MGNPHNIPIYRPNFGDDRPQWQKEYAHADAAIANAWAVIEEHAMVWEEPVSYTHLTLPTICSV